jgi:transposase
LPKDARTRETFARHVGADGEQLLAWGQIAETALGLRTLPALEALRRIGVQPYDRGPVPGWETLRWRSGDAPPPSAGRLASPDDLEARDSRQRETHWVGEQVPRTATCDPGQPDLIPQRITTPATTPECIRGLAIVHD